MEGGAGKITQLLIAWRRGEPEALARLMPLIYNELRRVAAGYLRRERRSHTLQPTALVHEVYLRLAGKEQPRWNDRTHFYAVAAQLMRRILVDHARKRSALSVEFQIDLTDSCHDVLTVRRGVLTVLMWSGNWEVGQRGLR